MNTIKIRLKDLDESKSSIESLLYEYLHRAKLVGIGRHSVIIYKLENVQDKDEFKQAIAEIGKKHGDCTIISFASDKITNYRNIYAVTLPKTGGIGMKLMESSHTLDEYSAENYKYRLGAEKIMPIISSHCNRAFSVPGLNVIEIIVNANNKLYDIARSKMMLLKKDNVDYEMRKLTANMLFGIERIGVVSKWELNGYKNYS